MGLIHEPQLVFLDEPTTGLDPQARANLWDHIRRPARPPGATVFLTTHYLDEADALCDRILVIDHGRIVAAGTPDELKRQVSGDAVAAAAGRRRRRCRPRPELAGRAAGRRRAGRATATSCASGCRNGGSALPGLLRALDRAGIALARSRSAARRSTTCS